MSDFLLTGRVNTAQIVKDITNAVKTANERLKDIKVTINTKEARSKIQSLRNLMSKEIKVDINTRDARNKIAALKKEIEAATAGFKTGVTGTPTTPGGGPQRGNAAQQASAFAGAFKSGGSGAQQQIDLLKSLGEQAGKTTGQVSKLSSTVTKFDNAIISAGSSIGGPLAKGLGVADDLFGSLGVNVFLSTLRLSAFAAAGTLVFGVGRALTDAVRQTIDLDQALTSINKVLNLSTGQLTNFRNELIKTAKESATSVEQVTEATIVFAQQGLSAKDIIEAVKASLLAVNASGVTFNDAVELLTVSVNSFGKSFSEATGIIERLSTIADITAADVGDLTTILARAGSTSDAAGVSLEQLAAVGAVVRESTRLSAETIGAAFKTIFVNVQANEKVLNDFGITTRDFGGNFLGVSKILEIAAEKFKGFNEEQKVALASLLTGKRRTTELIAILNGFSKAAEVQAEALASSGSASAKQAQQLETLSSRLARVSAQFTELVNTLSESGGKDLLKGVVTVFSVVLEQINNFASVLSAVPGLIPAAALVAVFKLIIPPISKSIDALRRLKDEHFASGNAAVRAANATIVALEQIEQAQLRVLENAKRQKELERQPSSAIVQRVNAAGQTVAGLNVPQISPEHLASQKSLNEILERRDVHQKKINRSILAVNFAIGQQLSKQRDMEELIKRGAAPREAQQRIGQKLVALKEKEAELLAKQGIITEQNAAAQKFVNNQLILERNERARNIALSVSFAGIIASGFAETIIKAQEASGEVSILGRGLKTVAEAATLGATAFALLPAALGPAGIAISLIIGLGRVAVGVFSILADKADETARKLEVSRTIINEIVSAQRKSAVLEQQIKELTGSSAEDLEKRNDLINQFAEAVNSTLSSIKDRTRNDNLFIPPAEIIAADIKQALGKGIRLSDLPVVKIKTQILQNELDSQLGILKNKLINFGEETGIGLRDQFSRGFSAFFDDALSIFQDGDRLGKAIKLASASLPQFSTNAIGIFDLDEIFPKAKMAQELADFSKELAAKVKASASPSTIFANVEKELEEKLSKVRTEIDQFPIGEAPEDLIKSFTSLAERLTFVRSAQLKYDATVKENALSIVKQARANVKNIDTLDEVTAASEIHKQALILLEKQYASTGVAGQEAFKKVFDQVLEITKGGSIEAVGSTIDKSIRKALASLDTLTDRQKGRKIILDAQIAQEGLEKFLKDTKGGSEIMDSLSKQVSEAEERFSVLNRTQENLRKNLSENITALFQFGDQLVEAAQTSTKEFDLGAETNKRFLDITKDIKSIGGIDLSGGVEKSATNLLKLQGISVNIRREIELLSEALTKGTPGGSTTVIKNRLEELQKLEDKVLNVANELADLDNTTRELRTAEAQIKIAKVNLEFREKEIELDARLNAIEISADKRKLASDLANDIAELSQDIRGQSLEFIADINLDRAIEKIEASNDKFKITSLLNVNLRGVEDAFKREIELAKQVRDTKLSFIEEQAAIELDVINKSHEAALAREKASGKVGLDLKKAISDVENDFAKKKADFENKLARDKFDNELSFAKKLADETFELEKNKIEKLSSAFERAVDEINNLKNDIGQTENEVVSQLQAVASAQDALNQSFFRFGAAVADFNKKMSDARFEARNTLVSIEEFANGLSFEDKLRSLNAVLNQSLRLIGGSEQKILEIRKQANEEAINIFKDQINELRSIGEQGFTASAEELLSRQIARSIGEAIKASPDIARNFSAAAGGEQLSRDLLAVAKEQAQLGDRSLLDILSQAGLDILGVNGNIEELTGKLVDIGTQQAATLVKLAELDTEQLNQARGAVSTAQQQLASDRERLANLQGLLAAQKQRLVDATNQAQFIGKKLNEARSAIDESKVAIVNAIIRSQQQQQAPSTLPDTSPQPRPSVPSPSNIDDINLARANRLGLLDQGNFVGGLFGAGAPGPGGTEFTGGFNVVDGLSVQGAQTGFNLDSFIRGLQDSDLGVQGLEDSTIRLQQAFGQLEDELAGLRRSPIGANVAITNPGLGINRARGSLTAAESMGLLAAARREKQLMPGGSSLGVFNTSETVLTRRQANLLLGTRPRGNVTSAAEGNIGEVGGISELVALIRDLLNQMRSGGSEKVDVNLTVDGTRTLNLQGVGNVGSEVSRAVEASIGKLATKDELNAVTRILNDVILRKLRERGIIGATLT